MSRKFTPKVVTANHLLEGDVIWLDRNAQWTRSLSEAQLLMDAETASVWLSKAQAQADVAVGAYLADAAEGAAGPEPTHFREAFRRRGPSNYAHGKQAEGSHV
ncbi:MAG: DUF2849 domain-containing protein [Pseudomonadota bacterium]